MNVKDLYPCQFEELREKLNFANTKEDLESVGVCTEEWDEGDRDNWNEGIVTDDLVIKSFFLYDFHCDDFFCTAGKYDEYPDRETDVNANKDVVRELIADITAEFTEFTSNLESDDGVYHAIDKLYDYLMFY